MQFREMEFTLGYKRADCLKYYPDGTPGVDRLKRRLRERSVVDHFPDVRERRGKRVPTEIRGRD